MIQNKTVRLIKGMIQRTSIKRTEIYSLGF
jgi:hypothetical protein